MQRRLSWCDALPERLTNLTPGRAWRTRFAPAPTGYMHLGHLVNAMHVWGVAGAYGGEVLLRIEDHDRTRCRPEYETALLDDLEWLGLEAAVYPTGAFRADLTTHAARQSNQSARYETALQTLAADGLVYACRCTRRDIAQVVPHASGEEPRYPGTCRELDVTDAESWARRVRLDAATFGFEDLRLGHQEQAPWQQCGDVLVRDRHGQWTYQFAVVVDDLTHHVDVIIRGEDLLASTGRQLQLRALLHGGAPPVLLHHTLLVHPDGSKLSKANRDTALRDLRADGASAAQLLGEAAVRAGLLSEHRALSAGDLPSLFS